jgi:maleate cis-trans isomerase
MHHFGVLVPSTNTTVEIEYGRLLPPTLQVHVARIPLLSSGVETTQPGGDADVDYQSRLLGSAKVEVVALAQTAASPSSDDFDDRIIKRMSEATGVPAITSARAIGLAVQALGARRTALVTPFPIPVLERLVNYYSGKYGLEAVVSESFSGSDSVTYPTLGQELARNFPTLPFISDWELEVGKPVITTNQATLWAILQIIRADEKLPNFGRLLVEMPAI